MDGLTGPYNNDSPTVLSEATPYGQVTSNVTGKLLLPKIAIGLRRIGEPTVLVSMPETAVNHDYCLVASQHDVRLPRQQLRFEAKAES